MFSRTFKKKISLGLGSFCGATGTLRFGLRMTLPMGFKARVDSSSPTLFCCLCAMIPRVISGFRNQALRSQELMLHLPVTILLNLTGLAASLASYLFIIPERFLLEVHAAFNPVETMMCSLNK